MHAQLIKKQTKMGLRNGEVISNGWVFSTCFHLLSFESSDQTLEFFLPFLEEFFEVLFVSGWQSLLSCFCQALQIDHFPVSIFSKLTAYMKSGSGMQSILFIFLWYSSENGTIELLLLRCQTRNYVKFPLSMT